MVNWVSGDPDYDVTTVEDYLDRFPPDVNDVIHVEPGSWAGADNGDPEFKKWLADPDAGGWSPDRNSWAVLTAAKNRVFMAERSRRTLRCRTSWTGVGTNTEKAWHWLLVLASERLLVLGRHRDLGQQRHARRATRRSTTPTLVHQRPARQHAADDLPAAARAVQPRRLRVGLAARVVDFEVWTYADDVSGLSSVTLRWRVDNDGVNPLEFDPERDLRRRRRGRDLEQRIAMTSVRRAATEGGVLTPTYRALALRRDGSPASRTS